MAALMYSSSLLYPERDASNREQAVDQEARIQAAERLALSFNIGPIALAGPPPTTATSEATLDNRPTATTTTSTSAATTTAHPSCRALFDEEEEEEEGEEEEIVDDPLIPPPSTAQAAITQSRAGRKRAPTMKALEAEKATKGGTGQAKAEAEAEEARGQRNRCTPQH
jgi:hypothetical protein